MNEDAIPSLEREIWEETGLKNVEWIHLVHTKAKSYAEWTHSYLVGYTGRIKDDQKVILSEEHDEYLWINPEEVYMYKLPEQRADTVKKSMNITL